jgi:hypothetical protein
MSHVQAAVHVRDAERARVALAIERRFGKRGFERVDKPALGEPMLVRVAVIARGRWVSVAVEELKDPDGWAEHLARETGGQALGAWFWDGEARLRLVLFEGAKKVGELSVPTDARRAGDGRIRIPLGGLSRLVGTKQTKDTGLKLHLAGSDDAFGEDGSVVYVEGDLSQRAFCRAFAIAELFPDPLDDDGEEPLLHFRPRASSRAGKQLRKESQAELDRRRADHEGRGFAVGWLAFKADARAAGRALRTHARPLVEAIDASLGAQPLAAFAVVPQRRDAPLPPPSQGDRAWRAYAAALAEGAMIELTWRDRPPIAAVWAIHKDGALVVGWSVRGRKEPRDRAPVVRAMDEAFARSCDDEACFGAVVTAQRVGTSLSQQALAFEYHRARSVVAIRPAWHRTHARAPGWRTLVPRAAEPPPKSPPKGFKATKAKAGLAVRSAAADPHVTTPESIDALEAWLAGSLGEPGLSLAP